MRFGLSLVALLIVACSDSEAPPVEQAEPEVATDPNFGKDIPGYKEAPNVPREIEDAPEEEAPTGSKANWDACAADTECQSAWCGCALGAKKVCLPATSFPKTCESSQQAPASGGADGLICELAEQCASKVCGCAAGSTKKTCLAEASLSKSCGAGAALGDACAKESDCASKVCGCSDSPKKKCLPDKKWITKCTK